MFAFKDWNHAVSIIVVGLLVILRPETIASLMSTPVGVATAALAIASVAANSPALGFVAVALIVTEKKEVEGMTGDTQIALFNKTKEWMARHCKEDGNGDLVFQDESGNLVGGQYAQQFLHGVKLGKGCEENPCSRKCIIGAS
jgi:hypothetical protein